MEKKLNAAGTEDAGEVLELGTKKKKKKKEKLKEEETTVAEHHETEDEATAVTTGAARDDVCVDADGACAVGETKEASSGADGFDGGVYSYAYLLSRLHAALREDHPSHPTLRTEDERHRSRVPPPQLAKVGGRRVALCNFGAIANALKRDPAHVQHFLLSELATTGAVDGNGEQLTIVGSLRSKHVEQLLRKYVHEYVACSQCKALDTVLFKTKGREQRLVCTCCNAERLLQPIKNGFRAVRRGERRAAR